MSIRVLKAGLLTTIQDVGRFGYQAAGVTVAGAMDDYAYRIANWLVGNDANQAVLEMTLLGAELLFEVDSIIAICGADMAAQRNGKPLNNWRSYALSAGDVLSFGSAVSGCRTYLAVAGGIDCQMVLGSRSTDLRARLGGVDGRALQAGDVLPVKSRSQNDLLTTRLNERDIPQYQPINSIALLAGPQEEAFTEQARRTFYQSEYRVSADSNRMAYRLKGAALSTIEGSDIISDAIAFGSIQVAADGQPMIMLADRQTTGGYAKIATVISSERRRLAQVKPGDRLLFQNVDSATARRLLLDYKANLARIKSYIEAQAAYRGKTKAFTVSVNGVGYSVEITEIID